MKTIPKLAAPPRDPKADQEQKRVALSYLHEAWAEAVLDGVDVDCMAQACLFAALSEMVSSYGEEAAARFTEGLASRIHNGEFSVDLSRN
jgi:predicted YcjX-like family ATPase